MEFFVIENIWVVWAFCTVGLLSSEADKNLAQVHLHYIQESQYWYQTYSNLFAKISNLASEYQEDQDID